MRLRLEYKWLVGIVFVFGIFMDLLDMTITNVALPTLAKDFAASTTTIQWVVTGYLLSLAVFIPVSGWAGDRFGTKRVFMFALSLFTLGSFLCGMAWNIESLIAFRLLQGVGGGMLTPVGTAMLFRAFPPAERAVASAVLSIPIVVAPASGPVLGGYLVEYQSWRWIFLINIPVGIAGLIVAAAFLREEKQEHPGRLDVPGLLLGGVGLAGVMYALAEAGSRGLDDGRVALFGSVGLVLLALFAAVELRVEGAHDRRAAVPRQAVPCRERGAVHGHGGLLGALFLLPLLLQAEMGLSPLESGLTTFPQAIGVFMMVQPAGRLYRRVGPRRMMMAGMGGVMLTTLAFLLVDLRDQPVVDPADHARPRLVVRADPDPDPDGDVRDDKLRGHGPGERDLQRRPAGGGELRRGAARDGADEPPDPPRRRPRQPADARRGAVRLPRGVHRRGRARGARHTRRALDRRQGGRGDDAYAGCSGRR